MKQEDVIKKIEDKQKELEVRILRRIVDTIELNLVSMQTGVITKEEYEKNKEKIINS